MTEIINRYGIYAANHTTFGGIIYPSDFNTDHRGKSNPNGSPIANRITGDAKSEKQWKINREQKEKSRQTECPERRIYG